MRTRLKWLMGLLTACMVLAPAVVWAQTEVPPADPVCHWPIFPFFDTPGEGFFVSAEFAMFRQTNPLKHQVIAVEGLFDSDGSLTGRPGTFLGSKKPVLYADDVSKPETYQPGFIVGGGWRWRDGTALDVSWMNLMKAQYNSTVTLARPLFAGGQNLVNTFLTAPVYNFPTLFAGPLNKIGLGNPGAAYGIWNGANEMNLQFVQRTEAVDATLRYPIYETENWRCYGLVGPRFFWVWEGFRWRTVDSDVNGVSGGQDVALYNNIVSNRMYGAHIGWGNEVWLGNGFAATLDLGAAALLDVVKERASYELGIKDLIANKRAVTTYKAVAELTAKANVSWYPCEGVQVRLGYDLMAFFNTVGSRNPVSFNYGGLNDTATGALFGSSSTHLWEKVDRLFDGLEVGVAFIF